MESVCTEVGTATFVMPFYNDRPRSTEYAASAVASVMDQSDPDWRLVIVDDCSPTAPAQRCQDLADLKALDPARIVTLSNEVNRGQGVCRNIGVDVAHRYGSPLVLFLDADDITHPRRLEVTRRVLADKDADFVYSPFTVIDEDGAPFADSDLTPSIAEILDELERSPVEGRDCWIPIATRTGYVTLTSTVSVRTELAVRQQFPEERGSEDFHTFLRMSGSGAVFSYQPGIPAKYRVNRAAGSADRSRWGREVYYAAKLRADSDGFEKAAESAVARGVVTDAEVRVLRRQFRIRLAQTIRDEGFGQLVESTWLDGGH